MKTFFKAVRTYTWHGYHPAYRIARVVVLALMAITVFLPFFFPDYRGTLLLVNLSLCGLSLCADAEYIYRMRKANKKREEERKELELKLAHIQGQREAWEQAMAIYQNSKGPDDANATPPTQYH